VGGQCRTVCELGFHDCDGVAANGCEIEDIVFESDPNHCGACNVTCGEIGECYQGACLSWGALGCLQSGGTISTANCCIGAGDFPGTCAPGPCGCGPQSSEPTQICICGSGMCFNGEECVPFQMP
jgi:hypothetical protein